MPAGISRPTLAARLARLADRAGADIALLGDLCEQPLPRIRTLLHYGAGRWKHGFSYPLAGSPCEQLRLQGAPLVVPAQARQRYPRATVLEDEGVEAYIGVPLSAGAPAFVFLALLFRQSPADPGAVAAEALAAAREVDGPALAEELEGLRLRQAGRFRDELYREYVLDNPEGLSLSELIPPVPVELPLEEKVRRVVQHGHVVECNKAIARMYGFPSPQAMLGARPRDVQGEERAIRMTRAWLEGGARLVDHESQTVDAEGNLSWILSTAVGAVTDGKITHFWTRRRDITDRKRYEAAIEHRAHHDALTGLPNRYWFQERVQALLEEHGSAGKAFALMLLDLNRFKEVNDTLGHGVGDELLQAVAKRLLLELRPRNADLARLGGDEFAILIPDLQGEEQADRVAEAALAALRQPFPIQDMHLQIDGSIGVSACPGPAATGADLLRHADIAMYAAKDDAEGYRWYRPDLDRYSKLRLMLLADLRPAIDKQELYLEFQPKISLLSGKVRGFEALVRWRHPRHGIIPPGDFIPLAETSELIQPLTQWVIREAIRQAAAWQSAAAPLTVAVNLSARNLLDEGLEALLVQALAEHDFPPALLELEITESTLMTRPDQSQRVLQRLAALGISLAIDDFGTGYSSLAYLARLPVSTLKIDQSFVRAMASSRPDKLIVRSVIGLATQMGLEVVAEGVEDEATLVAIAGMGCQSAQGYHIARPLGAEAVPAWLAGYARRGA